MQRRSLFHSLLYLSDSFSRTLGEQRGRWNLGGWKSGGHVKKLKKAAPRRGGVHTGCLTGRGVLTAPKPPPEDIEEGRGPKTPTLALAGLRGQSSLTLASFCY